MRHRFLAVMKRSPTCQVPHSPKALLFRMRRPHNGLLVDTGPVQLPQYTHDDEGPMRQDVQILLDFYIILVLIVRFNTCMYVGRLFMTPL